MKKIITTTQNTNRELIDKIKKAKINYYYINNQNDFRKKIIQEIDKEDIVLDCGKAMRGEFKYIDCKLLETLDVNVYEDYPDIVFDLCSDDLDELRNRYDKIICIAVLEHVYNPFKAVENLRHMLKDNGTIYGMVPYLYHYHAPNDLKFQDYFRFSKDALAILFKEFSEIELFPIRGRISASFNLMFAGRWKNYIEKTGINIFLDKFSSNEKNLKQCSGFNFIVKK